MPRVIGPLESPPRVSGWEWAQTGLLAANLVWTVACRGGYPPHVAVVTGALTSALLVVHWLGRVFAHGAQTVATGNPHYRLHPAGWILLPFLAYAAVNVRWFSPVPWRGWQDWFLWAQMIAVFWVVLNGIRSAAPQRVLFFTLVVLAVGGVFLACYQVFVDPDWHMLAEPRSIWVRGRGSGSFGMPNSLAAYLAVLGPVTAALSFRRSATATQRVWWGWVTLVLLLGLVLTVSRGAWLALVLAITVWPLCAVRGHWVRRLRIAASVLLVVAAVGGVIWIKAPSVRARLTGLVMDAGEKTRPIMWRAAWGMFRERPWVGTGAGSFDVRFEQFRPERFGDDPLWAHNEYLNTLSDYGIIGCALFFGGCAVLVVMTARIRGAERNRPGDWLGSPTVLTAAGIGLLAFALHLAVEFHFKIPAFGLVVATLAGIAVNRAWPGPRIPDERSSVSRLISLAVAGTVTAGYVVFFLPQQRAEALRREARTTIEALAELPTDAAHYRAPIERARARLVQATALDPANGQAWADLSYALALWTNVAADSDAELGQKAEVAAERALALSTACHEFWIRRGVGRDLQGKWTEANADFTEALRLAPTNAWAWYYYAAHLSRVHAVRESADAAAAFCLRLDPGNRLALALRQRLAIAPKTP